MAETSLIEWTDATWNPVTGCSVVSPGCANCYAMRLAGGRLQHHSSRAGLTEPSKAGPVWNGQVRLNEAWLTQPLTWKRPRRIFTCAHGDLFHESVPDAWIDQVFAVMALAPHHTFQVLTKRAARMRMYLSELTRRPRYLPAPGPDGGSVWCQYEGGVPRNVWLGVSAEDQARADERIPELLATPAFVRFLSAEPLIAPIELGGRGWLHPPHRKAPDLWGLDWVIAGGESGLGARPMHPDWARDLRDDCAYAGVAFFFKQWGEWGPGECCPDLSARDCAEYFDGRWTFDRCPAGPSDDHIDDEPDVYRVGKHAAGRLLDGRTHDAMPEAR